LLRRKRSRHFLAYLGIDLVGQCQHERSFGGEVEVKGALRDTCASDNLRDTRRLDALRGEDLSGRVEQRGATIHTLSRQRHIPTNLSIMDIVSSGILPPDASMRGHSRASNSTANNAGRRFMQTSDFTTFFLASAGAGAALVGLLFVAVSVNPGRNAGPSAPPERQAVSASAYTALINALFISLVSLIGADS